MKRIILFLFMAVNLFPQTTSPETLQKELGIFNKAPKKATCHIYLVHHGSTKWSEISRLQGWADVPLSEQGKKQVQSLASRIESVSAIYTSPLQSCVETSVILQEKLNCPIVKNQDFKGEYHGDFEGYTKDQYTKELHFQYYDSLPPEKEIFYPCGKNGESKADVAKRTIPALKKIAAQHIGENIVVVTHGGIFKLLNYYLGNYSDELGTISIPNGETMKIEANGKDIYLQ